MSFMKCLLPLFSSLLSALSCAFLTCTTRVDEEVNHFKYQTSSPDWGGELVLAGGSECSGSVRVSG